MLIANYGNSGKNPSKSSTVRGPLIHFSLACSFFFIIFISFLIDNFNSAKAFLCSSRNKSPVPLPPQCSSLHLHCSRSTGTSTQVLKTGVCCLDPKVLLNNTSLPHGPNLQHKRWVMAQPLSHCVSKPGKESLLLRQVYTCFSGSSDTGVATDSKKRNKVKHPACTCYPETVFVSLITKSPLIQR